MTARRPAIVDTNVVVSGLLTSKPEAPTRQVLAGMLAGAFPFLLSVELLAEYRDVLLRPAIQARHKLDEPEIERLLENLVKEAIIRAPDRTVMAPDPDDQHIWDLLSSHPQALLVTGDRQLVDSAPSGMSVLSPAAFVELLRPAADSTS
jgi:putative PIN family toxin of toxin-antitoxin system